MSIFICASNYIDVSITYMDKLKKKKRGRPLGSTVENTANKQLPRVRVTEDQLKAYKAASEREGKTFSAWVRGKLDASC